MVRLQKMLIDHLGIARLLACRGGSMGGMQALEWAVSYPDRVSAAIPIATTARHSAQQIAFNEVGRQAIMADPDWNEGNYYGGKPPARGLAVARMVGHITYMSDDSMREKFGRRLRGKEKFGFDFDVDFEVESYLRYRGSQFVNRFDANSYLYITKAMDYFDLTSGSGSLAAAFERVKARFLVISFTSDWLYPELSVAGDRARAARPERAMSRIASCRRTTATMRFWWTSQSRRSWCADFWPARSRRSRMTAAATQCAQQAVRRASCWGAAITPSSARSWSRAPRCWIWVAAKANCWQWLART